jgi:WD40 repeat protein
MRFQAGGAIQEESFYVRRAADRELNEALAAGLFCYVLATTQTGKSSLKVHAARHLVKAGARVALIDLTDVAGESTTVEQWYHGLAWSIARKAGLADDFDTLWDEYAALAPNHRWSVFLREHLVPRLDGRLVVFLDEINVVLSLSFSADGFFASLRELYDGRANDAQLKKLSFCLLGIASTEALMKDPARSPFRDSTAIVLDDFTRVEMDAFLPGLEGVAANASDLLDEVFAWTHGHPYMTQRVCSEVVRGERDADASADTRVKRAVEIAFLDPERAMDPNLRFAERYVARDEATTPVTEMLYLYRRLLEGETLVSDPDSHVEQQLRLSGLAAARAGEDGKRRLEVRNRVFAAVLDREWVREREAGLLLEEQVRRWLAASDESKEQFVLHGKELEEALTRAAGNVNIAGPEGAFLRASQEVAARETEHAAKIEKERAREARLGARLLAGLVAVLVVALVVAGWQYRAARNAVSAENTALAAAQLATRAQQGLRASALAGQPGRETEALLLGIDAVAGPGANLAKPLPEAVEGMTRGLMSTRQLAVFSGHTDRVSAVAFSPDGTRVITGSSDNTARLWDARDGKPLATLQGHTAAVGMVAFSPDGTRVITGSSDNTARLWDARDGKPLATLQGHTRRVLAVAFSPDGTRVLTGSLDYTARLWDARDGKPLTTLQGHTESVPAVAFSPNGTQVLTGSSDNTARLWDARDGKPLATLQGHTAAVGMVAFSPDGTRVLTGSYDDTARLWDARDGKPLSILKGHTAYVAAVAFSPDGTQVLTGSGDYTARLWDARSGQVLAIFRGHTAPVRIAVFSPDGTRVLTGHGEDTFGDALFGFSDKTARLWDTSDGKLVAILHAHTANVEAVAFSPDGTQVLTGSADKTARLWAARDGKSLAILHEHTAGVAKVTFSPDGTRVLTASFDNTARIWDARGGKLITTLQGHTERLYAAAFSPDGTRVLTGSLDKTARLWDARGGKLLATLQGHTDCVTAVAFSPDGTRVVTGSLDKTARLWEAGEGKPIAILQGHTDRVSAAAFAPDSTRVLTGSFDHTARMWDARDGKPLATLQDHTDSVYAVAFSPDGTRVLTGGDNTAKIWDARNSELRTTLKGHTQIVYTVAFSPDSTRILTGSLDTTARIWDARDGKPIVTLQGHTEAVWALAFSQDGTRVLTGSLDTTARLWDARDGQLLAVLPGHLDTVSSVAFSPDGRHLVTASLDGTARIWAATPEGFLIQACQFLHPWPAYDQVKDTCAPYVNLTP